MATTPEEDEQTILAAAREVVADASSLVRAEAGLIRLETAENMAGVAGAAGIGLGGLVLLVSGFFALVAAGLVALAQAIGWLNAFLLVAAVQLLVGLVLLLMARSRARHVSLLPHRALARIENDLAILARDVADKDNAEVHRS